MSKRSGFEYVLLGALCVAVGGSTYAVVAGAGKADPSFLDPILVVKHLIDKNYVDSLDEKKLQAMQTGAINGMIEALNDPYTVYVPPEDAQDFNKDLLGEYVGIGAQVNIKDNYLTIVSPLENSPALRAGLMPDDKIIEINGESTLGKDVDWCIDRLLGQPATSVDVKVQRGSETYDLSIIRRPIKTKSVKGFHRNEKDQTTWDYMLDEERGIAYIRITQFTPRVSLEVAQALLSAGADQGKVKGLVMDLRFNPGGLLSEAVNIADLFLDEGVIVSTKGRSHPEVKEEARRGNTLPNFPLVVLLNEQSASASEVLAGALVENNRAVVVGTRSFGKGSVQSLKSLDNGGEFKITEQGYYLPSGRSISRKDGATEWGVDPTKGFYVPMTDDQLRDMILTQRKLELLKGSNDAAPDTEIQTKFPTRLPESAFASSTGEPTEVLDQPKWNDHEWVLGHMKDPQLSAAVKAVQAKLDTGEWKATGEEGVSGKDLVMEDLTRARELQSALTRQLIRLNRRVDTLEKGVGADPKAPRDLWADDVDVTGGKVQVYDKDGKLISTLKVPANTLEAWLIDAELEPDGASSGEASTPNKPDATPAPEKK